MSKILPNTLLEAAMNEKVMARFWSKVDKSGDCWNWRSAKDPRGYGYFSAYGRGKSPIRAYRLSKCSEIGREIPKGIDVCHKCDNPSCVRPDHLFLGSHKENMLDAKNKGRLSIKSKGKSGERNNSAKLSEGQAMEIIDRISSGQSLSSIGREFGVHRSTVGLIKKKKKWKHLYGQSK